MNDRSSLKALVASQILTENGFVSDHAIILNSENIQSIVLTENIPENCTRENFGDAYLVPGLIDLQVNGGNGLLFNNTPTSETVRAMASAHRLFGTTSIMPTVISDTPEKVSQCISAVDQCIPDCPGVLGIHIEGPFFSPGKRGVHQKTFIRAPDDSDIELYSSLKHGKTLVTLAPEKVPIEFIEALSKKDIVISAGHSGAEYHETVDAIDAGLSGFTHLFNAMPSISGRKPGLVTAALLSSTTYCGIIADLIHVHPASIELAMRCLPKGHLYFVSDAMATIGAKKKSFLLYGEEIHEENGQLVNAEGKLAGAAISQLDAVKNAVNALGIPLDEAIRMASTYPANYIGVSDKLGSLSVGKRADILCLDQNLKVVKTWVKGS